jgi:hypothetical protein
MGIWRNKETRYMKIWLENTAEREADCSLLQMFLEVAQKNLKPGEEIRFTLANLIEAWVEVNSPFIPMIATEEVASPLLSDTPTEYSDILRSAVKDVCWTEIADSIIVS